MLAEAGVGRAAPPRRPRPARRTRSWPTRGEGAGRQPVRDRSGRSNPFLTPGEDDDGPVDNPFAPRPAAEPTVGSDAPRKLRLLGRGLGVFGIYAKVLLRDDVPAVYAQFGPLSAYPRAQRTRELYPALPDAPLPAVITCIATTAEARGAGLAATLVEAVCDDLAGARLRRRRDVPDGRRRAGRDERGDAGVLGAVGFALAIDDERFPVMRRELA